MATIIDGSVPCVDPSALYQHCVSANLPVDWVGKANLFRVPMGRGPGTGGILLTDFQLSSLNLAVDHTLTFLDSSGNSRTLRKITILRGRVLTPGGPENDNCTFLCEVADRRHFLAKIPVDKAFNIPAADGLSYLASSLNGGAAWTWQTMVSNLCTTLGLSALTLPFTPHGVPENFLFWGSFAWEALNQVLDRLACTIRYDIEADTFSIIRRGDTTTSTAIVAAQYTAALKTARYKLWDDYANEPNRGKYPEKIRVLFPRKPQPTDGTSIFYTLDVPLTGVAGLEAGTYEILHDDLTAIGAGVPTNAVILNARATERANDWVRKRRYSEARTTIVYRDFQQGMALLAETGGDIAYDDASGAGTAGALMATEVSGKPDGLMEKFRAYEQPFVLPASSSPVSFNSPFSGSDTMGPGAGLTVTQTFNVTQSGTYLLLLHGHFNVNVTGYGGLPPFGQLAIYDGLGIEVAYTGVYKLYAAGTRDYMPGSCFCYVAATAGQVLTAYAQGFRNDLVTTGTVTFEGSFCGHKL